MTQLRASDVTLPGVSRPWTNHLLEAYSRGRYAGQVMHNTTCPYRDHPAMAEAWFKGFKEVCGET